MYEITEIMFYGIGFLAKKTPPNRVCQTWLGGILFSVDCYFRSALIISYSIFECNILFQVNYQYELYRKLTSHPDPGHKIIGHGEAASISLAQEKQGILASNNLRDISVYVTEYGLSHLTTGDIMKMAFDAGYINESQGNTIWDNMIARKRKLGYASFSDYLAAHQPAES